MAKSTHMSALERAAKEEVAEQIILDGCSPYLEIFDKLDFNLTEDPGVVAYFEPSQGRIVMNSQISVEQMSLIARHEILHYFLKHEMRLLGKLSKEMGKSIIGANGELEDMTIQEIKQVLYGNDDFNIAADYEISNVGYTEEDKREARKIILNGEVLTGLVTEDEHPDWINLSVEEMYDKVRAERAKAANDAKKDMNEVVGKLQDPTTFIGADGVIYGI